MQLDKNWSEEKTLENECVDNTPAVGKTVANENELL